MKKHAAILAILALVAAPCAYAQPAAAGDAGDVVTAVSDWVAAVWDAVLEVLEPTGSSESLEEVDEDQGGLPSALPMIIPTG